MGVHRLRILAQRTLKRTRLALDELEKMQEEQTEQSSKDMQHQKILKRRWQKKIASLQWDLTHKLMIEYDNVGSLADYFERVKKEYLTHNYTPSVGEGIAAMCDVMMGFNLLTVLEVDQGPLCKEIIENPQSIKFKEAYAENSAQYKSFAKLGLLPPEKNARYYFQNLVNGDSEYALYDAVTAELEGQSSTRLEMRLFDEMDGGDEVTRKQITTEGTTAVPVTGATPGEDSMIVEERGVVRSATPARKKPNESPKRGQNTTGRKDALCKALTHVYRGDYRMQMGEQTSPNPRRLVRPERL